MYFLSIYIFQEYEKEIKALGICMNSTQTAGKKRPAQSMLESPYSKTFIYTPQTKDVDVKEVGCFKNYFSSNLSKYILKISGDKINCFARG